MKYDIIARITVEGPEDLEDIKGKFEAAVKNSNVLQDIEDGMIDEVSIEDFLVEDVKSFVSFTLPDKKPDFHIGDVVYEKFLWEGENTYHKAVVISHEEFNEGIKKLFDQIQKEYYNGTESIGDYPSVYPGDVAIKLDVPLDIRFYGTPYKRSHFIGANGRLLKPHQVPKKFR